MTREEFELEYANRHMRYDPRSSDLKSKSVFSQRQGDGYIDTHIDRCWKDQQCFELLKNTNMPKNVFTRAKILLDW